MTDHSYLEFALKNSLEATSLKHYQLLQDSNSMKLYKLEVWPLILKPNQLEQLKEASEGIICLLQKIPTYFFMDNFYDFFKSYASEGDASLIELAFTNNIETEIAYRPDFIITEQGWKCLEINAGNAGGWIVSMLAPIYSKVPIIARYLESKRWKLSSPNTALLLFKTLVKASFKRHITPFYKNTINSVIIVPFESKKEFNKDSLKFCQEAYCQAIYEMVPDHKGELAFCQYDDLQFIDEKVFLNGKEIHIIYEEEIKSTSSRMKVLRLSKKGCLHVNPGIVTRFLNDKRLLALLSENQQDSRLGEFNQKLIYNYIPWTRQFLSVPSTYHAESIYLPDFVFQNREKMVLKKAVSHGGEDVFLGKMCTQGQWSVILEKALIEKDWVVQEMVFSNSFTLLEGEGKTADYEAVWGPFVIENKYAGGFVRILSPDGYVLKDKDDNQSLINSFNSDKNVKISPIFSYTSVS
jgi:hypothetical protein